MIDAVPGSSACLFVVRDDAVDRRPHRGPRFLAVEGPGERQLQRAQCGENLLRLALGHATGTSPAAWGIGHTPAGRPVVTVGPNAFRRMHISLAHSGPFLVAAASASGLLAVDLEVMRERRYDDIARYLDWPGPEHGLAADAFFHLWTLWETTIKLASANSLVSQAELFAGFVREIRAGQPSLARIGALVARSWLCPERFWMTALVENTDEVRLFHVQAPLSQALDDGLEEIDAHPGSLAPQTFDRPGALCLQGC